MFKFRLAKFLYIKSLEEKNRLGELNKVRGERLLLLNQIAEIEQQIRHSRESLHSKIISNRGSGYMTAMQGAYEQSSLSRIAEKKSQAANLEKHEALCRLRYEEAYKKRKVLENLKEKQYVQYLEEKKKKQSRFYDEVLVNNYSPKQGSNEGKIF